MTKDKFKVVADGSIRGVQIFAPDGSDVTSQVQSFTVKQEAGGVPVLTLDILSAEIDVTSFADKEYRVYAKANG